MVEITNYEGILRKMAGGSLGILLALNIVEATPHGGPMNAVSATGRRKKDALAISGTVERPKSACTPTQAIELLDELRKCYQGLPPEQRKKVKAFIRERSCTAIS